MFLLNRKIADKHHATTIPGRANDVNQITTALHEKQQCHAGALSALRRVLGIHLIEIEDTFNSAALLGAQRLEFQAAAQTTFFLALPTKLAQ